RAAEVADFLAHDEDALVAIEFLAQCVVESFAVLDLRHRCFSDLQYVLQDSSTRSVVAVCSALQHARSLPSRLPKGCRGSPAYMRLQWISPPPGSVVVDVLGELIERRLGALFREADRILDNSVHFLVDRVEPRLAHPALLDQVAPKALDRVALLPDSLLAPRAVFSRVGHRMAAEAIGHRLDQ